MLNFTTYARGSRLQLAKKLDAVCCSRWGDNIKVINQPSFKPRHDIVR